MPFTPRTWTWTFGLFVVAVAAGAVVFAALNVGRHAVSLVSVDIWLLSITAGVTLGVVLDARRHPAPPAQPTSTSR